MLKLITVSIAKLWNAYNGQNMFDSNDYLFSFGFDIQFAEYISRLNKKRKAEKQQREIGEIIAVSR